MPTMNLLKALNNISQVIPAELDVNKLIQLIVDQAVSLVDAEIGAFFYHVADDENNDRLSLVATNGKGMAEFSKMNNIPSTPLLGAHQEAGSLLLSDVQQHPLYGSKKIPTAHPPVRSYLAVKLDSRSEHNGSLYLGHSQPDMFRPVHEEVIRGLADIASIAMDNAILFSRAQQEIEERTKMEKRLLGMMEELNHRVKNNLATVLSIAQQTKKSLTIKQGSSLTIDQYYKSFDSRVHSLSRAHDMLTRSLWVGVDLRETIIVSIAPVVIAMDRVEIEGPSVLLNPTASVTMNLVFHELARNAVEYGAFCGSSGSLKVSWELRDDMLEFCWQERGGPPVHFPLSGGFGTRLIEKGVMLELGGCAKMHYEKSGLRCWMSIPVSEKVLLGNV